MLVNLYFLWIKYFTIFHIQVNYNVLFMCMLSIKRWIDNGLVKHFFTEVFMIILLLPKPTHIYTLAYRRIWTASRYERFQFNICTSVVLRNSFKFTKTQKAFVLFNLKLFFLALLFGWGKDLCNKNVSCYIIYSSFVLCCLWNLNSYN